MMKVSESDGMEQILNIVEGWLRDPVLFVRQALQAVPSAQQEMALRSFGKPGARTACKSGHGTGKTTVMAWVILWALTCFQDVKIPCTAPTAHQLRDGLWPEARKWAERLPSLWKESLEITDERISYRDCPGFAVARTGRKENPEALQGFHARHLFFLCDEASGIDDVVFEVARGALSTKGASILMMANPTRTSGYFFNAFHKERDSWDRFTFSCLDSPHVSPEYAREVAQTYGEDSDIYRVRVLGEFPRASDLQFIASSVVDAAADRQLGREMYEFAPVILGVDVARFGSLSEAAKTAAQIRLETDKAMSPLFESMTDFSIKDDSQLIAQLDKNGTLRHLQQGKTTNFFQDVAFSAADLWTQWGQSGLTGLKYLPAYTGAALAVGAKTGGLLNPFGAGAALGTGVAASLAHGAFEHTLKVESASEYATLRGMNVDKPTAALLALAGGAVKAGIEMNIFSRLSEYIPGMPKMDKFLSLPEGARSALAKLIQSEGVSPLVQIPTIRNALASRAKKYAADVGSNTVEEVMQDGVDILTEAIGAYLADNSNMPPQEAMRKLFSQENAARLAQTAAESAKTFAYGMLPAAAINAAGAGWSALQVQKTPQAQRAEALNNWHAAQSHKGNGEQASLSDVVFIPAEVFQQFNQGAADEQIGADETVAVESTGEVMMSRAAYEKLAAENEEFAKATASKVRVGAFGRTFEENAKILRESETDPLNDPNDEWAHEAREIRDEITQEMKDAGFDDATAEAAGTIYAKNRLVRAVRLGTDELGIRRDDAKSPKQLRQIEIDNQRAQSERAEAASVLYQALRDGINLEERVPVIDISEALPEAKGMSLNELTAQLKGMIGQELSISRDALGFLSLPAKSSKIRHIAHSGAPVPTGVKAIRNASVLSLPELMKNAVLVETGVNTKQDKKADVLNYLRFYVPVMVKTDEKEKVFVVRIVTEEKKTSDGLSPVDVDVYDVVIERKRTPSPIGDKPLLVGRESSLREITIGEMLKNVKGMDGQMYNQIIGEQKAIGLQSSQWTRNVT